MGEGTVLSLSVYTSTWGGGVSCPGDVGGTPIPGQDGEYSHLADGGGPSSGWQGVTLGYTPLSARWGTVRPIGTGWGYPSPHQHWMGVSPTKQHRMGVHTPPPLPPPSQETEQQSEHLVRSGWYASCVQAGGLSCSGIFIKFDKIPWFYPVLQVYLHFFQYFQVEWDA